MKRTWIYNATIVNEGLKFAGSVVVEDDTICEVLQGEVRPSVPCDAEIDARGCYLIPGVIDDHVHFRDPGLTHKADMASETAAAAAGGVDRLHPETPTLSSFRTWVRLPSPPPTERARVFGTVIFGQYRILSPLFLLLI